MNRWLSVAAEVAEALRGRKPVVALESTLISHGMPWPENATTALMLEQVVRDHGAVPATIAVMEGKLQVGLSPQDIERLARQGPKAEKVSRYNLAPVLCTGKLGATTVAATMWIAAMAGIAVFATGGIGGVHRGWSDTLDISADLEELARTRVAVVSAGAKAILDLEATLEYLETKGVPVIGFGTDQFPAFFTASSGLPLSLCTNSVSELARWIHTHWQLNASGGVLVANPIPQQLELKWAEASKAIDMALNEARQRQVRGKALTPFLLDRITALTLGKSLAANVALVKHNARLAVDLAKQLADMHSH